MKTSLIENGQELNYHLLDLEKKILNSAMEWAREVFELVLEQIDSLIQRYRSASLHIVHKRNTWYRTRLGLIRVTRRQYQGEDGKYRYLLDEAMGMAKYRHTTVAVEEIVCQLAAEMPFRKSAEFLNRTTPVDLSHQTIHRLVQSAVAHSQNAADTATTRFSQTGEQPQSKNRKVSRLMIEADGVFLSLQREAARKTEVKLSIAYEGWRKIGKDRYSTVNKTVLRR